MKDEIHHIQTKQYWHLSIEETAKWLQSNINSGLSLIEVKKRLDIFGSNILESSKKNNPLMIFLRQLMSPLIFILIIAAVITLLISHYRDAIFIFIAVLINSLLGFWQENKAEQALGALKSYLKQKARVVREGKEWEIPIEEIVPGDIIKLSQGDRVPADARIIFVNDFQIDESILTGESLPVTKSAEPVSKSAMIIDQKCMVFTGTLVTQGICTALVCHTNINTEFGKIASMVTKSETEKTPLQKSIIKFSIYLSILLSILTIVVFLIGIFSGQPPLEMFLTSIAIAVSAIPEGLPISMTIILAIGVERMAKRKGVVRKLIAAEALGSTTVILTDKTGTLTQAKMVISKIIPFQSDENILLEHALKNTNVFIENPQDHPKDWRMDGKIMEMALVQSAGLRQMPLQKIFDKTKVIQTIPFNAVQKFSASLLQTPDGYLVILLGAPDILLAHSCLSQSQQQAIFNQINTLASSGERLLGLASKKISLQKNFSLSKDFILSDLLFDGLMTFRDPLRPGIKQTIERVKHAGIKTIILTGDHQGTAIAVAREIGMMIDENSVLDARELNKLSDQSILKRLPNISVISRVTPFDKLRIAQLLQSSGEIVAMTGDGVNDAPSIKQANVGIAMGSGTEVAKSVADLILLDDNFETIVAAVEEGRQILSNIRKVLVYLLSNVADGIILIGGSILAGIPLPLNALQILWVNFFTDSFPAIAFAFEKNTDNLSYKSKTKSGVLFDPLMKFLIVIIGVPTSILLLVIYIVLLRLNYPIELIQTFMFAVFGTYTLLIALPVRSLQHSIFSYPLFSNQYLTAGIAIGFLLMIAAIYLPGLQTLFGTVTLPIPWVLAVLGIGILNIFLIEITKQIFRKKQKSIKIKEMILNNL
ncbi:hypothetical protein CO172_00940 [Candidatus Uhrbacteria bacterium CG_4_9_14_3_um_filter_36_7]|uniref:Cation-transporting P-type ATPase N-terminal domain-containing protein n=1 Tax=Candidatus Uhrbacteria bacterium CG_4_9_14_3_um_filter_36_7 TaxID=1975033 RepID=A0A2M7XI32_9BACT|nr:MAG: hypothetical protein CO172_00940 [Candidatus Uhrbacteria bacterium CG_4_9_14_3_um_filter_36_7]